MSKDIATFVRTLDNAALHFIEACVREEQRRRSETEVLPPEDRHAVPTSRKGTCLSTDQMEQLSDAFRRWYDAARAPTRRCSRGRLWLVFLLVRHAALRLGEALALNDVDDIDTAASLIHVRGQVGREIQLSREVMTEIRQILESPDMFGLRGRILELDQGYVRRIFYARGQECGLPAGLSNPRVLRHSRGVELLRNGMPPGLVQTFLGRRSPISTLDFLPLSDEETRRIMYRHLRREALKRTSARNIFAGTVSRVTQGSIMTEVELTTPDGLKLVSVITTTSADSLDIQEGSMLTASVKAPWLLVMPTNLFPEDPPETHGLTPGNRLFGTVEQVRKDGVTAEILLKLDDGTPMCALMTQSHAARLAPGSRAAILFSPFAVILGF